MASQRPTWARCGALGTCLLLGACAVHSVREDPPPPIKLPGAYTADAAAPSQGGALPERWWSDFSDPELARLVDAAFAGNFDLQAAWARLSQAEAGVDIADSPFIPQVNADVGGSINRNVGPQTRFLGSTVRQGKASLSASYELDIWRRLSSGARAAELDRLAAFDAVQSLAMTLAAEVAEAWYDLVLTRGRRQVLEAQLQVNQTFVEVIEVRFSHGQANAVELNQQRQQVIANRAALERLVASERVLVNKLSVLVGRAPQQLPLAAAAELPSLPPLPATGLPSELLQRRPDLRAAQRKVEAADHRVAAAVADRYPRLSLSASIASQPSNFNQYILDPLWTLAANLALPLIDGGRRAAEVDRTRAVVAEAVAGYGKAVLGALVEVENALVQERQQLANIQQLQEQEQVSALTLEQARQRYGHGLSDFLTVLTALRSHQEIELGLLDAQRQLLSYRIQLCRALGGTWTQQLSPPAASEEEESS